MPVLVPKVRAVGQPRVPLQSGRLGDFLSQEKVFKALLTLQDAPCQAKEPLYLHFSDVMLQLPFHSLIQEGQVLHDGNHHHVMLLWSLRCWRS